MIGVFGMLLVLFGSIMFGIGILNPANKVVQQRLAKMRARHMGGARGKSQDAAKRLMIYARNSNWEDLIRRFIPRPAELRQRLNRTGRNITFGRYAAVNAGTVTLFAILSIMLSGLPPLPAILIGLFLGLGLPHYVVSSMIKRRENKFTKLFPEAIDLIVRGLKSGLPVTESINAVGREMEAPIGKEFRRISDDIRLGMTMTDALWKATKRITTPELKFFVISLSVQQETGGNLAETLGNLSGILRARQQMKLKIRAMSSEGRASAMIIGSLPFIMFGIIMMMNFEYAATLYTDPRAQMFMIGSLVWMGLGMGIIAKMISFEI
ncbi:MAG: type II secretion system F family protein [Sphingomonadales bacterium]